MPIRVLRASAPSGPLYHYTTQAGLLGIINSQSIWATSIQYLNDSSEYRFALALIKTVLGDRPFAFSTDVLNPLEVLTSTAWTAQSDIFVASFSEHSDQLSQWRAYARGGNGFAIGFDVVRLAEATASQPLERTPCIYDRAAQIESVEELLGPYLLKVGASQEGDPKRARERALSLLADIVAVAPMLKDPAFSEEREWRLVSAPLSPTGAALRFREGKSFLIPYREVSLTTKGRPIPITDVVVGPTPHPDLSVRAVMTLLANTGINATVRRSGVPFRDW